MEIKKLISFIFIMYSLQVFSQQNDTIVNPSIWYNTDFYCDSLNYYIDISGNGNHGICNDTIIDDTILINFQKCKKVVNLSSGINIDYKMRDDCELTIFFVYRPDPSKDSYNLWNCQIDSSHVVAMETQRIVDLPNKIIQYADTTICYSQINLFRKKYSDIMIDTTVSGITLFKPDSVSYVGSFGEFILYDEPIDVNNVNKIHTYLALKYGVSLIQMDYVNSKGVIIWNYKESEGFNKNIAGIGKDTSLNINQKQSRSSNETSNITISAGTLCQENNMNNSVLADGDFLIWSDNGLSFEFAEPDSLDENNLAYISEKKWKMYRTGSSADQISTNVTVFAPGLADSSLLFLAINREGNFNFPVSTTELIYPVDFDTLGNYYFNNVYWDTDSSGFDAFAFQSINISNLIDEENNSFCNNNGNSNNSELIDNVSFGMNYPNNTASEFIDENYPAINPEQNNPIVGNFITYLNTYPNPSDKQFYIELKTMGISDVGITVFDICGRKVDQLTLSGSNYYLIAKDLFEKGCYLIYVEIEENIKVVKQVIK